MTVAKPKVMSMVVGMAAGFAVRRWFGHVEIKDRTNRRTDSYYMGRFGGGWNYAVGVKTGKGGRHWIVELGLWQISVERKV